ncbi:MAG: hypothetical protein ACQERG_08935 [Pseudomonadota bacterium]
MRERLRALGERTAGWVEDRARRERLLGLLALMAATGGIWWLTLGSAWVDRTAAAEVRTADAREEQARVAETIDELSKKLEQDPDEAVRTEIREVRARIDELTDELRDLTADLIPPDRMKQVLRRLLGTDAGTRFIALRTRPTETILEPDDEGPGIYRHGVELVFEADYAATTAWLERVEDLPWRFGWQRLEYEVVEHPRARVILRLFTLSGHEDWLGV